MAEKKDEKVKNEVHENKIWIERVTKEKTFKITLSSTVRCRVRLRKRGPACPY